MKKETEENARPAKFVEGLDFYYDNGLVVLTARFLRNRGYCCGNNCRHCPYTEEEKKVLPSK